MTLHQPFELQYWLVNVFSGDWTIFSLISVLAISWACAMFRMPMGAFLVLLVIYSAILLAAGQEFLIVLIILILAPPLFWTTRRIVE